MDEPLRTSPSLVVIAGPTGSGKSDLALKLARRFDGEILNCDSVQVYRHFNIGTAKTPENERAGIPHHLIDALNPDEVFTAGDFSRTGRRILAEIAGRGRLPIVSGGTGFYIRALIGGLAPGPQRDDNLRSILGHADLVLCDGKPIVWASRLLGGGLPARVAGSDLIPRLLKRAEEKGWRVFLLGGSPEVGSDAARLVAAAYPALGELAHYSPPFRPLDEMDDADIIARVHAAKPDLMLVCFGCPKQEKWIARHRLALAVPVMIGAGATIDFLAGRMARAPVWMRRSGMEWLFRLLQEPTRLAKRYADDFLHFFPAILLQRWRQRPAGTRQKRKGDR